MPRKHEPQRMAAKKKGVNLRGVAMRSVTTVTLAAMIGGQLLSPVSAIAAQADADADQAQHPAVTAGLNLPKAGEATDKAADEKLAELQAALEAAKAAEAQKKTELEQPKADYDAAQATVGERRQAADVATKVSDDADAKAIQELADQVAKAKEELDSYQANVDKANTDLDAAKKDADTKQATLADVQAKADAAAKDLEAAKKAAANATPEKTQAAEKALADAQAAYDQAQADLTAAQTAKDAAAKKVTDLTARQAMAAEAVATANAKVATANTNVADAQAVYDKAQAAYDAIVGGEGGEMTDEELAAYKQKVADAKADMDAKKAALDEATSADAAAKQAVTTAQGEVTTLAGELKTAQSEQAAAQAAYDKAKAAADEHAGALQAAKDALDAAKAAEAEKLEAYRAAQADVAAKQKAYDDATAAREEAVAEYNAALLAQKAAQKALDDLKAQSGNADAVMKSSVTEFFQYIKDSDQFTQRQRDAARYAFENLTGNAKAHGNVNAGWYDKYVDSSVSAGARSAMSVQQLVNSLTYMDAVNNIRKANNLNELYVSLVAMAGSALDTCYSSNVWGHAANSGQGSYMINSENLASGGGAYEGSSDPENFSWPFSGWYTREKNAYESGNRNFADVGHYLNFINEDTKAFGIGTGVGKGDKTNAVTIYIGSYDSSDIDFTVTDFKKLVSDWVNGQIEGADQTKLAELTAKLDAAKTRFQNADDALAAASDARSAAEAALDASKTTENNAKAAYDAAKADTAAKQSAYDKLAAESDATGLADAKAKLDAAKGKTAGVQSRLDAATAKLTEAQNAAKAKADALAKASSDYAAAKSLYEGLVAKDPTAAKEALDKAARALSAAKAAQTAANTEKAAADSKKSEVDRALADAQTTLATATHELNAKTIESENAAKTKTGAEAALNALRDAAENLKRAEAADADAKAKVSEATQAVDAAKADVIAKQTVADKAAEAIKPVKAKYDALKGIDIEAAITAGSSDVANDTLNALIKDANDKRSAVDAAKKALDEANAKLGEVSPAYVEAKEAYDRAVAERDAAEKALADYVASQTKPEENKGTGTGNAAGGAGVESGDDEPTDNGDQQSVKHASYKTDGKALPQTGDDSAAAIAMTAAAGLSMVGVAEILRRRREHQR